MISVRLLQFFEIKSLGSTGFSGTLLCCLGAFQFCCEYVLSVGVLGL